MEETKPGSTFEKPARQAPIKTISDRLEEKFGAMATTLQDAATYGKRVQPVYITHVGSVMHNLVVCGASGPYAIADAAMFSDFMAISMTLNRFHSDVKGTFLSSFPLDEHFDFLGTRKPAIIDIKWRKFGPDQAPLYVCSSVNAPHPVDVVVAIQRYFKSAKECQRIHVQPTIVSDKYVPYSPCPCMTVCFPTDRNDSRSGSGTTQPHLQETPKG
jgi:hypothetical protein